MRLKGSTIHGVELWESIADAPIPVEAFIRMPDGKWWHASVAEGMKEVTFAPTVDEFEKERFERPTPGNIKVSILSGGGSVKFVCGCGHTGVITHPEAVKLVARQGYECRGCGIGVSGKNIHEMPHPIEGVHRAKAKDK